MTISIKQITKIEAILKDALRRKFQNYKPEPAVMPFHTRLLGEDRMALFSFIHSLNTNFGSSIFEPVAIALAEDNFKIAKSQESAGNKISDEAQLKIGQIIEELSAANKPPNKIEEIAILQDVCQKGNFRNIKPTIIDIWLESHSGELFLFDLKTSKPNKGAFKEFKRTLLEWTAVILAENPQAKINTIIAIPYNPYDPAPYSRWTMAGMLDLKYELKVADEFWDFLGGVGTYKILLDCFEKVGIELRNEIDDYFSKYQKTI